VRASRLVSLLLLLQTRGRMTARDLASELEVSVRTVYRDVESLSAAGVPVYGDRGPAGGYQLVAGYRTKLTGMTREEADSLFLAGVPGPAAELGLGAVLAGAQLKLLAALPPELRDRAGRVRERFLLDAPGWYREADRTPHLAAVADAVWRQVPLRIRYERWEGQVDRTVHPLGLVLKAGIWYCVAAVGSQPRTYRVSKIQALTAGEPGGFRRPSGFELATYWRTWSKRMATERYRGTATVRLAPGLLDRLHALWGDTEARAARASASPPDAAGWVRVRVPIESVGHAATAILRLGVQAEAIGPPELRTEVATAVRTLSTLYADPTSTTTPAMAGATVGAA
jgi:predicted DNA-binding transcriptional regulator YafY